MAPAASRLICSGCGYEADAADPLPFRCPRALPGDDVDHVLRRHLDTAALDAGRRPGALFADPEPNPFLKFRRLLHSYQAARRGGWSDARFCRLVEELDTAVATVDGRGFRETPLRDDPALARRLGVARLWLKDETGNVGDSHKGRHLMGLMIWLRVAADLHPDAGAAAAPLAIASCGNAALAAAIVAKAAGRTLRPFVPPEADPAILERFAGLGFAPTLCPRTSEGGGDPSYRRFREAVSEGAVPFTVQGPDNGLTLEGGATLGWEIAARLAGGRGLDRLLIQVGGGALAASTLHGLREARQLGVLPELPRIHAVQTMASPLGRAWDRLSSEIVRGWCGESGDEPPREGAAARATWIVRRVPRGIVAAAVAAAARRRSRYMWPWEGQLRSAASSILDDETYDWLAVVEGMLTTGGWPLALPERVLLEARGLAREALARPVSASGSAGLAAALALAGDGVLDRRESVAVLITGIDRQ